MLCRFAMSPLCRLFYSRMVGCGLMSVDVVSACNVNVMPFVLHLDVNINFYSFTLG